MGSFMPTGGLRSAIDPIGSIVSKFAGPNSWFAKESAYDPLISSPVGKFLDPGPNKLGQEYANRNNPANGNWGTPGFYAGQAPSLSAANAGYQQPGNTNNYVAAARAATAGQPQRGNQVNPYGS